MVGGLVEKHHVRPGKHHPAEHTAHLFTAGEDVHGLEHVLVAEQHPPKEAPEVHVVLLGGILAQPVHQFHLIPVKIGGIVLRQIAADGGHAPLDAALVRLQLAHEDLEQGGLRQLVFAHEGDLVPPVHGEIHFVQQLHAVHGDGHVLDGEHVLAQLPLGLEAHEGITAGGAGHFLHGQLV